MQDRVIVQEQDFDIGQEHQRLTEDASSEGAVVTFCGLVRDNNLGRMVQALHLEHYPAMTQKQLAKIVQDARAKWNLGNVTVIHRVGTLALSEQIVFVGVTTKHRGEAFLACEFIMDFLKTRAPFWKKEITNEGEFWVEARNSDEEKARNWASP